MENERATIKGSPHTKTMIIPDGAIHRYIGLDAINKDATTGHSPHDANEPAAL